MRILGIDPGLNITGYGVVEKSKNKLNVIEAGAIRTSGAQKITGRLNNIYAQMLDLIKETMPQVCVLEKLYSHYKHPQTSILMAHARGVIVLAAAVTNIKLVNYPAKTVKKAVTGNGNASKEQVKRTVEGILNLKNTDSPFDVTDALALCLAHIYHTQGIA
ncbi:MAG: crossover junction endodeoxyribonuclease RuvC [Candidatus Omnitrophica bacterium]|nr:crossover junction endodeoxyribonuclease RuvC [Candidatus Omnitrophota bacterium]